MFAYAEPEQKKTSKNNVQKKETKKTASSPNLTGIPDDMKSRFENFSGFSFDDVRVHYNSDKPTQLQALAYTQGSQVYISPGQEKHLGHELGHVVQQKQGIVRPTIKAGNFNINDDPKLEQETDIMAKQAADSIGNTRVSSMGKRNENTVQLYFDPNVQYRYGNGNETKRKLMASGVVPGLPGGPPPVVGDGEIGVMYEMMCPYTEVGNIITRFKQTFPQGTPRNDVGLSIVANRRASDLGGVINEAKVNSITAAASQINPPIHVEKVVWGVNPDNNNAAATHGDFPYFEHRKRAATNPGAQAIHDFLGQGGRTVWRRMGDNDMTFHDPSSDTDRQIAKVKELDEDGKRIVTFAYNLTSPDASFAYGGFADFRNQPNNQAIITNRIKWILTCLYEKEANLRSLLVKKSEIITDIMEEKGFENPDQKNFKYYPSEPTTYYKADNGDWGRVPQQTQQVKEGANIKAGLGIDDYDHEYVPDIKEDTGAGNRNNALISALIISAVQAEGGFRFNISQDDFITSVTSLDQSYFNPKFYLLSFNQNEQVKYKDTVKEYLGTFFSDEVRAIFR